MDSNESSRYAPSCGDLVFTLLAWWIRTFHPKPRTCQSFRLCSLELRFSQKGWQSVVRVIDRTITCLEYFCELDHVRTDGLSLSLWVRHIIVQCRTSNTTVRYIPRSYVYVELFCKSKFRFYMHQIVLIISMGMK